MEVARCFAPHRSPVEAYEALDADAMLENGVRGWDETVVAAEPVSTFVYERGDDGRGCFGALSDWLGTLPEADEATDTGAYGFVGYDAVKEYEEVPDATERDIDVPDAYFGFYDTVAVLRDDETVVEAVAHDAQEAPPEERAEAFADRLRTRSDTGHAPVEASGVRSNFDRAEYEDAVGRVKERIREGETFQANISQRLSFDSDASPLDLYARLRRTNPAPYMGLLEGDGDDGWAVVSSSPELLVRVHDGRATTRPIAGTRPRGDGDRDGELADELRASEKERAEHSILVDLARNDLGAVAEYGTVDVEEFAEVVPYTEVQHLESVVTASLREDSDSTDALRAMFPGGTVTGAPKPRTLRIIEEVEPTERGPYTGSMGRFTLDGDATFNILIRTAVRDGGTYHLQVGGGVVHDSESASEYDETLQKARGVLNALEER